MDELEHRLKEACLPEPSAELERRMSDVFAAARERQDRSRNTLRWWWMAALTGATVAAALVAVSPRRSLPKAEVMVHEVEAHGRMREMLLNPTTIDGSQPQFVFRVSTP